MILVMNYLKFLPCYYLSLILVIGLLRTTNTNKITDLDCDFDSPQDFCDWSPTSSTPSSWKWSQFSARTVNFTGPFKPVDNKGSYILSYNVGNVSTFDPTAILVSPAIDSTNMTTCFQFYYFIHGVGVDRLDLTILNVQSMESTPEESSIWSRHYPAGDIWHLAHIHIPEQPKTFKLKFSVYSGGGAIALDQFIGIPNECPFDGECDFESGMCDWHPFDGSSKSYRFNRILARDESDNGLMIDHTTQTEYGHLLQARNGSLNDRAIIVKDIPSIYSAKCLIFWYFRERSLKNRIEVTIFGIFDQNLIIWNSSLTYPTQRWHRAIVPVFVPDHFGDTLKLGISAVHLDPTPMYSPINIDDTSLRQGRCPEPITCDFNVDLCGFVHNIDIDSNGTTFWTWDQGFGRVEFGSKLMFKYPPEDRTAPSDGMFLFTDFTSFDNLFYSFRLMRIDSEYVSATSASCLSFYYISMDTTSNTTVFVVKSYDSTGKVKNILWTYSRTTDPNFNKQQKSWTKVNVDINMTQEFRISFEVSTNVPNTYIALDDISYKPGKCFTIQTTTVSPIQSTTIEIPHQKQVSCDFESGDLCGWTQSGVQQWMVNRLDDQYSYMRPLTDHTIRNSMGRYAYIEHSNIDSVVDKTAIMTVEDTYVSRTGFNNRSCFSLWFYMRVDTSAQLMVASYSETPNKAIIESTFKSNDWGEKWNQLRFETYQDQYNNWFNITAHVKNGVVSIDDIKVSHNPCSQSTGDIYQCDFEDSRYQNCGFGSLYTRNTIQWQLVSGLQLSKSLPDHTLGTYDGHMMAIQNKFDDTMASQWYSPTAQGSCLSFAYLMSGLKNGETLKLQIIKETSLPLNILPILWSVSSDLGDVWYTHRLTIISDLRWRIAFTGVSNNSNSGIMAIDDLNIDFDKPCPPPGKCDFELGDTCMWQNKKPSKADSLSKGERLRTAQLNVGAVYLSSILNESDFMWTVHSPSKFHFIQYPLFDHTIKRPNGYYLLMKADPPHTEGQRSIIMSERYDVDPKLRQMCLSFYYFFKGNGGTSAQTQLDIYQSEQHSSVLKIAKIISPTQTNNDWVYYNTTVNTINSNSTNIWFYLVGTIIKIQEINSYRVNLAIDDISVTLGMCPEVTDMFSCGPTERIPKNKVCNRIKDCSNGYDENVCGSCDFENQFSCGYRIDFNYNNISDQNLYKWRFGDYSNGPKSGSDHSNGYMIARRLGPNVNEPNGQSDLTTPVINGAQSGCFLSFKYNIKRDPQFSAPNSTLSVLLKTQNGFEITEIWNSDALEPTFGQWMSATAYLKRMNYNFSIAFRGRDTGQTPDSYVAVDNIVFHDCDRPQTRTGQCNPETHYQCNNGGCLSKYYVCDFSDDCGDNSDEMMCSNFVHTNDFESGLSGWTSQTYSGWQLSTGSFSLINGQTRDHSIGTGSGHFLYLSSKASEPPKSVSLAGPVIPNAKGCRITLWTDIVGNASFTLKLFDTKNGIFRKQITEFQPINTFTYERQIIDLYMSDSTGPSNIYQIYFEGSVGPKSFTNSRSSVSYIAIDDISLSPDCRTTSPTPTGIPPTVSPILDPCPANKPFNCNPESNKTLDRICIELERVCDFFPDCDNNADEKHCGTCSFDKNDMCGWTNIGDSKQEWTLQNANRFVNSPIIPNMDSNGNKTGSFIIIDTSRGGTYNTEAIISTPTLGPTAANCELTFYYHHWFPEPTTGLQSPILTIKINYPKTKIQKTITEIRKRVSSWTKVVIPIGAISRGFQVWIAAKGQVSEQTGWFADIQLDGFQFAPCESEGVNWDTNIDCDFESGTCGWTDLSMNTKSKLDWVRESSSTVDPGYDHTSRIRPTPPIYGHWMRTRKEPDMTGNNTAALITVAQINDNAVHCLTFWYHMWGSNLAQFELVTNTFKSENGGRVLWIRRAPQSNNWIKESITVQSSDPFYLMFRATLQPFNGRHEDTIGLDDIKWTDGVCPQQTICDFERDLCGWNSKDSSWERTVPSNSTNKSLKPRVDHTLGLESGAYVRLVKVKDDSILSLTFNDSTPLDDLTPFPRRSMCLKFWYYRSTTSAFLNKVDLKINETVSGQVSTVWTINDFVEYGFYNEQWMFARVNLTLVNKDIIFFNGKLSDNLSVIAIDDIQLLSHSCEPIGWCDFESDLCGWTNASPNPSKNNIQWLRNSGSSTSTLSGPKTDHTTLTEYGWYAFVPSDSQQSGTAILLSEPIDYEVLCLKFYYQISSENQLIYPKLQIMSISPENQTETLAVISSTATNHWMFFNITHVFNMDMVRYRIMFKTLEGNITQSDVAVDDIQIWSDTCADVNLKSLSTPTQIPTTQTPDIERAFDCDFESPCSKWTAHSSQSSFIKWVITHWVKEVSMNGPLIDHTMGTSGGHYLLLNVTQNNKTEVNQNITEFSFVSNTMVFTDNPNCLSFWYYTDSESFFNITVSYRVEPVSQNPSDVVLYIAPTMTSNSWKQMSVQLPTIANISVQINVIYHKLIVGSLAFDDITLTVGKCPQTGLVCDFSYNNCGFQFKLISPPRGPKIGFLVNDYILKNYKLKGPDLDHTTASKGNYFLFANQVNDSSAIYATNLIIGGDEGLPPTQYESSCLSFWYQITGQTSSLSIYVLPINGDYTHMNPKWTVASRSHLRWTLGRLTFRAIYRHKVVFALKKPKDNNYIALDDISIRDGVCDPPVSCDFDVDSCDWYQPNRLLDSNWKWARFTVGLTLGAYWPGPIVDHTLRKDGGSYLYMAAYRDDLSPSYRRNAYIESMPVPSNQSYCLSFYSQLVGKNTSLQLFAIEYGPIIQNSVSYAELAILLDQFNQTLSQKWTKFTVKLDPKLFNDIKEVSFRFKGSIDNYNSFIALDDINLNQETQCAVVPQDQYMCADGTQLNLMQVCNFIKECSQGEDESKCGNCDFEQDWCQWTNFWKSNNQMWIRKSADNRTMPFGPAVDGQDKPNGYYLMISKQIIGYNRRAIIESNPNELFRMKGSHSTCRMYFDYYINGTQASLRVIVREGPTSFNYVWRTIGSTIVEGQTTPVWRKRVAIDIGEHRSQFSVEIEGDIQNTDQTIAIDDISFESCIAKTTTGVCPSSKFKCPIDGDCVDQFSICDGIGDCQDFWDESPGLCDEILVPKCSFESNNICPQVFTIESDIGSKANWFLVNTAYNDNLGRRTGPVNDHTYRLNGKGIYLALNGSTEYQKKKSRLVSTWMQNSDSCAIRFFYYMYGTDNQMGSLRIYGRTKSQTILNSSPVLSGNLGQQWYRAILAVNSSVPFQFVIEGQVGTGNEADIAIDDISFSNGCVTQNANIGTSVTPTKSSSAISTKTTSTTNTPQQSSKGTTVTQAMTVSPIDTKSTKNLISTSVQRITSTKSTESTFTTGHTLISSSTQSIGNKRQSGPKNKGIGPYGLAASISVPILVIIAAIIGFIFFRRYRLRNSEDRTPLNPTVINLTERRQ